MMQNRSLRKLWSTSKTLQSLLDLGGNCRRSVTRHLFFVKYLMFVQDVCAYIQINAMDLSECFRAWAVLPALED